MKVVPRALKLSQLYQRDLIGRRLYRGRGRDRAVFGEFTPQQEGSQWSERGCTSGVTHITSGEGTGLI